MWNIGVGVCSPSAVFKCSVSWTCSLCAAVWCSVVQCGAVLCSSVTTGKARFCSGGRGVFSFQPPASSRTSLLQDTSDFGTQHPSQHSTHVILCHKWKIRTKTSISHWDSTTMDPLQQNSLMSSTLGCHMRDGSGLDLMGVAEKKASWRQTNRRRRKKWRNEWRLGLMWCERLFSTRSRNPRRPAGPNPRPANRVMWPADNNGGRSAANRSLIGWIVMSMIIKWVDKMDDQMNHMAALVTHPFYATDQFDQ